MESEIKELWEQYQAQTTMESSLEELTVLSNFLDGLEDGEFRPVEQVDGDWQVNEWIKRGIVLNFGMRQLSEWEHGDVDYNDMLPLANTDRYTDRGTRNTPNGTVVRRGGHVGNDCVLLSPSFVNIGAFVDDGTVVGSCCAVGTCAYVGADVTLGGNVLVGGAIEPIETRPAVVEDGVSLGAGCRVSPGFVVGEGSIVEEQTLLAPQVPVYDLVDEEIIYGRLPPERHAVTRYVESALGDHDLFDGTVSERAIVATAVDESPLDAADREYALDGVDHEHALEN